MPDLDEEDTVAKRRRVDGSAAGPSISGPPSAAVARPSSPAYQEVRRRKAPTAAPAAAPAVAAAAASDATPTKFGYSMAEYQRRREDRLCLGCGEPGHSVNNCVDPAWLWRKARIDAEKAAAEAARLAAEAEGKGKGKGKRWPR
ncbi:hypothetical protein PLESTF_001956300, partial [Pleodorina starrii]